MTGLTHSSARASDRFPGTQSRFYIFGQRRGPELTSCWKPIFLVTFSLRGGRLAGGSSALRAGASFHAVPVEPRSSFCTGEAGSVFFGSPPARSRQHRDVFCPSWLQHCLGFAGLQARGRASNVNVTPVLEHHESVSASELGVPELYLASPPPQPVK